MNDFKCNEPSAENQMQDVQEPDEAPFHEFIKHHYANLLSSKEAAEMLGVSTNTIRQWRNKKIFGVPIFMADEMHGDAWYYYRERIEQLKSVYHKGIIQNIYKLAKLNPDPNETLPKTISSNFQSPNVTSGHLENKDEFYSTEEVANILGINEKTLRRWRDKNIFVEDKLNHYGIYLYSQDRVMEMKLFLSKDGNDTVNPGSFSNVPVTEDPAAIVKKLNGSIRPSRTRIEINDKLTKVVFNLSDEDMSHLLSGNASAIIEKRNHKGHGNILTFYKIRNADGYRIQRPFTLFDRFVLSACISEWVAGNRCITPAMIYRALVGKVNRGSSAKPSKDQLAAINDSIKILMCRTIDCTAKDLCEVLGYNEGKAFRVSSPLLPAAYLDAFADESDATAVFLLDEPPLLKIARIKGQLVSYDSNLLDIPRQQNNPTNIVLKNYCMLRVQEILTHRQLPPAITFNDIFAKARMEDVDKSINRRTRRFMNAFFKYLQSNYVIDSFEIINHESATAVRFSFNSTFQIQPIVIPPDPW